MHYSLNEIGRFWKSVAQGRKEKGTGSDRPPGAPLSA